MPLLIEIPWEYPFLVLLGFFVSIINTMAGGASIITLPILIFLGLPSNVANGTNRIGLMMTAFSANMGFKSKGISTFPFSAYTGAFALVGSVIGAHIAVEINDALFNKILSIRLCSAFSSRSFRSSSAESFGSVSYTHLTLPTT